MHRCTITEVKPVTVLREPRFNSDLAVLVIGTDVNGHRFKQTARVENVSRRGGRLTEIRCLRAPGDVVEIQHRGTKANFRVVWIDVVSGRAGLCCVDTDNHIWGAGLPFASSTESLRPAPAVPNPHTAGPPQPQLGIHPTERSVAPRRDAMGKPQRRFPRYRCMAGVAASIEGVPTKVWGRLNVIGLGGCFIETTSPFRPQTRLSLLIGGYGVEARITGEVRYAQPGIGMGISFTAMSKADEKALETLVATASARQATRPPVPF